MSFKLFYYIKRFGYNFLPTPYFKNRYKQLKQYEQDCDKNELNQRLAYYFKIKNNFPVPSEAIQVQHFKKTRGTDYYLDLKEFLHYFNADTRFAYRFGDDTSVNPYPTLLKARPILGDNANSVLFKLNKRRHFYFVNDKTPFSKKKNKLVWRGGAYQPVRKDFVRQFWNHPLCNVGQTNKPKTEDPWQKDFLSIKEQLQYKFIFSPEGNDVATSLKWIMSSNSLCLMPPPTCETWFMEGTLIPGTHYVQVKRDFSDLEEKMDYYTKNTAEAEQIIQNAQQYVRRFQNPLLEDLLCLKVLERYALMSHQNEALKFNF